MIIRRMSGAALGLASAAALSGCMGTGLVGGDPVSALEAPVIEVEPIATAPEPPYGISRPTHPRTLALSGDVRDRSGDYWLNESAKVQISQAARTIPHAPLRRWLHGIAAKLLKQAPPNTPPVQVHVLGSPSYEALAQSTGDIYISINLLAQAQSEDEVAITLAHEIGHVLLDHHAKDEAFREQRQATTVAAGAGIGALGLLEGAARVVGRSSGLKTQEKATALAGAKLAVDFVANDIVSAQWNREQEAQADLIGIDLAVRAGYSPYAMYNSFGKLVEAYEERTTRLEAIDSTISSLGDDLEAELEAAMEAGTFSLADGFNRILGFGTGVAIRVGRAAMADARDYVREGYYDPTKRMEWAEAYRQKFYADVDREAAERKYASIKRRYGIVALNNAYAKVDDALGLLQKEDFSGALKALRSAMRRAPSISDDAFPRLVEAYAYLGLDRPNRARQSLRAVGSATPLSVDGYIMLAELEADRKAVASALRRLDTAEKRYGRLAIEPTRLKILAMAGRRTQALKTLEECQSLPRPTKRACDAVAESTGLKEEEKGFGDAVSAWLDGAGNLNPFSDDDD